MQARHPCPSPQLRARSTQRQLRSSAINTILQERSAKTIGTAEACILLLCPCATVRRDAGVAGDRRLGCASCVSSCWGRPCRVSHRPHRSFAARHIATRGGRHAAQGARRARRCETRPLPLNVGSARPQLANAPAPLSACPRNNDEEELEEQHSTRPILPHPSTPCLVRHGPAVEFPPRRVCCTGGSVLAWSE